MYVLAIMHNLALREQGIAIYKYQLEECKLFVVMHVDTNKIHIGEGESLRKPSNLFGIVNYVINIGMPPLSNINTVTMPRGRVYNI